MHARTHARFRSDWANLVGRRVPRASPHKRGRKEAEAQHHAEEGQVGNDPSADGSTARTITPSAQKGWCRTANLARGNFRRRSTQDKLQLR
eukprot:10159117-Alexandrium_andersonii.AAC.1